MHVRLTKKKEDVLACSLDNWYGLFKKDTVKSVCIPLEEEILTYLCSGGTVVSDGPSSSPDADVEDSPLDIESDVDWDAGDRDLQELKRPEFSGFDERVASALAEVGGAGFVKLNWSAPLDVRWLSLNHALRSQTTDDVHLLLRSSDRLQRDLCSPLQGCVDAGDTDDVTRQLIIRQWVDISPESEFRCFVRDRQLIGLCQRDISQHIAYMSEDSAGIIGDVRSFFEEKVQQRFPLSSYTFDVYRPRKDCVKVVDFAPFAESTDPLLFTWSQLCGDQCLRCESSLCAGGEQAALAPVLCPSCSAEGPPPPVFHCIDEAAGMQRAAFAASGLPYDVVHLATSRDAASIVNLLRRSQMGKVDFSSDEEDGDSEEVVS